jgi:hypothetical protein
MTSLAVIDAFSRSGIWWWDGMVQMQGSPRMSDPLLRPRRGMLGYELGSIRAAAISMRTSQLDPNEVPARPVWSQRVSLLKPYDADEQRNRDTVG